MCVCVYLLHFLKKVRKQGKGPGGGGAAGRLPETVLTRETPGSAEWTAG